MLGKAQSKTTERDTLLTATVFNPEFFDLGDGGVGKTPARITPFTTLADTTFDQSKAGCATGDEYAKRLEAIAKALNLKSETIAGDYNDPTAVTSDSVRAVAADELLLASGYGAASYDELAARTGVVSEETLVSGLENTARNLDIVMENLPDDPAAKDNVQKVADDIENTTSLMSSSFIALSSGKGADFRCAATRLGNVYCWGSNAWANLGDPEQFKDDSGKYHEDGTKVKKLYSYQPAQVKTADGLPLSNITQVETGRTFACAVAGDGAAYCWGDNYFGQTGTGALGTASRYTYAASRVLKGTQNASGDYLSDVTSIALGRDAACALTGSGEVLCWGNNSSKQLGADYADHDDYKSFQDLKNSDGSAFSHGFAVKAVPYPVALTFPDGLKMTKVAAGDWAFCAIADADAVKEGDSNLFCWGNDTTGLIGDIADHSEYSWEAKEKYAKLLLWQQIYSSSSQCYAESAASCTADNVFKALDGSGWTCTDGEKEISASAVNSQYSGDMNRAPEATYSDFGRLTGRDWLVRDSNDYYHPLFGADITRIESVLDMQYSSSATPTHNSVSQDAYYKYHSTDANGNTFRKLTGITDVAFGQADMDYPSETQSQYSWRNNSHNSYNDPSDRYLTIGFYTDENAREFKRWMVLSQSQKSAGGKTYFCSKQEPTGDGGYQTINKTIGIGQNLYVRGGTQLVNNSDSLGLGNGSSNGLDEHLNCSYERKNAHNFRATCEGGFASFDGETFYPENGDLIKASNSRHSSCVLEKDAEDATGLGTVLLCNGFDLFGQLGHETDPDAGYTSASYGDLNDAWKYSFKTTLDDYEATVMGFAIQQGTQAQIDELYSSLSAYLGKWNKDVAWASLSCGASSGSDDPASMDSANESLCQGKHGTELRNADDPMQLSRTIPLGFV